MSQIFNSAAACIFFVLVSNFCSSQSNDSSYSFLIDAKASALLNYNNLIKDQLGVFNGAEYVEYGISIKGNPFFLTSDFSTGYIEFDDMLYQDIALIYEVVQDKVLIEYYDYNGHKKELALQNDRVKSFEYEGHNFVNVNEHNPIGSLKNGFYDVLLDDEINIYASRRKQITKSIKNGILYREFSIEDQFFIRLSNNIHRVSGKSSLFKLFGNHKNELKQHIKTNRLDFKHNFEESLISVTKHYIKVKQENETF